MGKTTVLQDVLKELKERKIPVLSLKADTIKFENFDELQKNLNLKDSIEKILANLSDSFETSVVIIDQIDSLSLSITSDRTQLTRYKELILHILKFQKINVIISCRTFDLNNDFDLSQYQNNTLIEIDCLKIEEVIEF